MDDFAVLILAGISDNWSQVRMASSIAARSFLLSLTLEQREKYYSRILPPICINRYYIAAGVRIHNQGKLFGYLTGLKFFYVFGGKPFALFNFKILVGLWAF